jgi:hypothetical protein
MGVNPQHSIMGIARLAATTIAETKSADKPRAKSSPHSKAQAA